MASEEPSPPLGASVAYEEPSPPLDASVAGEAPSPPLDASDPETYKNSRYFKRHAEIEDIYKQWDQMIQPKVRAHQAAVAGRGTRGGGAAGGGGEGEWGGSEGGGGREEREWDWGGGREGSRRGEIQVG